MSSNEKSGNNVGEVHEGEILSPEQIIALEIFESVPVKTTPGCDIEAAHWEVLGSPGVAELWDLLEEARKRVPDRNRYLLVEKFIKDEHRRRRHAHWKALRELPDDDPHKLRKMGFEERRRQFEEVLAGIEKEKSTK